MCVNGAKNNHKLSLNFCPPKTKLSLNLYKKIFDGWIENTLPVWRGCHCIDKDQCMHQTIFLGDIMLVLTASTKIRKQKSKFLPSIISNMSFFFMFLFCFVISQSSYAYHSDTLFCMESTTKLAVDIWSKRIRIPIIPIL